MLLSVCEGTQTCFGDGLEVSFEDCSVPLPAEGEGDQHNIPRGRQLHDRGQTRNGQSTPPETGKCIQENNIYKSVSSVQMFFRDKNAIKCLYLAIILFCNGSKKS